MRTVWVYSVHPPMSHMYSHAGTFYVCECSSCLCLCDRYSSFEQHTPGDAGWMMNDTITKRCLPSFHHHPSLRDLLGVVALPKSCRWQTVPPRTFFTNLHGAGGWISTEQQGKKARPWVSVVSTSWWTDTTRGCCLKTQHIFIFRDVFGLHQCLLAPLFLMFHYAGDQSWQPKQSLIRTAYSLNEWALHLLTPLTSPLKCALQHLAEPVVAARTFLIQ